MLILDENQGKGSYSLCLDLEYISLSVSEVNNEMVNKKKTLHNLCKRKHLIVHLYRVHPVCLHPQLSYTDGTYCIHPQLEFTDGAYHNIMTCIYVNTSKVKGLAHRLGLVMVATESDLSDA